MRLSGFVTLALSFLVVGAALVGATIWLLARLILRPPRMNDGRAVWLMRRLSPGDLGMSFEEMRFVVDATSAEPAGADRRIPLRAWWIPAASAEATAILLHGYGDAKVGAIAWAPMLHALGFNVLALDLRAHGESGGRYFTAGVFERNDVNQVIHELQAQRPVETKQLVLFGINSGATVAAATAALRESQGQDVAAIILDGPFPAFAQANVAYHHALGVAGPWMQRRAVALAQKIAHTDFGETDLTKILPALDCPMMIVQSAGDRFVSDAAAEEIRQAAAQRAARLPQVETMCWTMDGISPFDSGTRDLQPYWDRLAGFLNRAIGSLPPIGTLTQQPQSINEERHAGNPQSPELPPISFGTKPGP